MSLDKLAVGTEVTSNIRLVRPLGAGAMGCVWVAEHCSLETEVAVKFISEKLSSTDPEIVARFEIEAKAAAKIKSPHVVQTFDQGMMPDGTRYIVMELLAGESLADRLEREGQLHLGESKRVVTHVARALSEAHALGIVHRDIKPENIFLCKSESGLFVKLLDFGVAKRIGMPTRTDLTSPGAMVGTPEYLSRDQVVGLDVDHFADLWALTVVAYEMLTGDVPFTGEAAGSDLRRHLRRDVHPPEHAAQRVRTRGGRLLHAGVSSRARRAIPVRQGARSGILPCRASYRGRPRGFW